MSVCRLNAGRRWSVNSGGMSILKRKYVVEVDGSNLGENAEALSFAGVPAIGSAHPFYPGVRVKTYDVEEGEGNEKKLLTVWVNYELVTSETVEGEGETPVAGAVEDFGWDDGVDERELITGVDDNPLVNSAGDPFDSVPRVSTPAPVFTKVIKFPTRQAGWSGSFCKINSGSMTVAGVNCPKWTLLCVVSEKRIFGDAFYRYRYTIRLRYRSNLVKLNGTGSAQEIGWNVAVADTGMRELGEDGKPVVIRHKDAETGRMLAVASPELLDGKGHAVDRSSGGKVEPFNMFFKAYEEASFPGWFFSEPA